MIKDQLNIYNPAVDYSRFDILESIVNDSEGLTIILSDENDQKTLNIRFESPIAYRAVDVFYMDKLWSEIDEKILGKVFYTCSNSSFLEHVHETSLFINVELDIQHYVIHNDSFVLDVLSVMNPLVSIS